MDILDDLIKDDKLNITWENGDKILGKSPHIYRNSYVVFKEHLLIIKEDDKLYLKFSCDDENNFLTEITSKKQFMELYETYMRKHMEDGQYKEDYDPEADNGEELVDPDLGIYGETGEITDLPFENTVYFYGGLCPEIEKLEAKMLFNCYLSQTSKEYKTSYWIANQPTQVKSYNTIYSNSVITFTMLDKFSVQLDTKSDASKFHPLIIKINYKKLDKETIKNTKNTKNKQNVAFNKMCDSMMYDILPNDMPYDIWGALQNENIFNEKKVKEMIDAMNNDLKNEKDYLNFILDALRECNESY